MEQSAREQLQEFATLKGIDLTDKGGQAQVVVTAAQYFFMPKQGDLSQCRLARKHAKQLMNALRENSASPEWFQKAIGCAQRAQ